MKLKLHSFHYRWILIIVGTTLYFMANVQRTAIPGAIFNVLQQELQASATCITSLGAVFMYVYALNQLVIGMLIEKYGGARVIAVGALLFCAGSLMFPLSHSLFWLYFSRGLTGLGASSIYLSLVKEIRRASSDKNFSLALAIMTFAGYTGGIMANAPFVAGVALIGWRPLMLIIALSSIALFLLFLFSGYMTKLPRIHSETRISFRPFFELLKIPHNLYMLGCTGVNFGMFYVIQTMIGKKFLEDFCSMSSENAAWVLSLMATLAAVVGMVLAVLSRLAGNRRRIFLKFATTTTVSVFLLIILALVFDIRSGGIAVLFCILTLASNLSAITVPMVHETNSSKLAGATVCFMNFSAYIAVAVLGNAVGLLMSLFRPEILPNGVMLYGRGSYLAVFSALFLLACFTAYCAWHTRETWGRNIASEINRLS